MGAGYALELSAPDIRDHREGNTGIEYVSSFESGQPGPHVMLSAVVHGNEIAGAIVLDELLRAGTRPRRGRLTLAFANAEAYERFDPAHPTLSRFVDEDLNRLWSAPVLNGRRTSAELGRARALRPILDTVDFLLDIHSMQYGSEPLALCGPTAKGRRLACELGFPAHVVSDVGHAAGKRMRDYARFADERRHHNALLIECGEHWRAASVDVAREMAIRFLLHFELIEPTALSSFRRLPETAAPQLLIEVTGPVTVKSGSFRFTEAYRGLEVIAKAGTVIGHDGEASVATPYDDCVLVMPSRRLSRGGTAVRFGRYVDA